MTLKQRLLEILTWWNGATVGTRVYTWRYGEFVGTDELGNQYYRTKGGAIDPTILIQRRWVIFNGEVDASKIPPGWRGWLANTTDVSPADRPYQPREWELDHVPNMTGTMHAYRPRGSILSTGQRPAATGDYVPWTPEN